MAASAMETESLKIVKKSLHVPQLDELKDVLGAALAENFQRCSIEIVDCPDLTKAPFGLADSGLGGKPTLLEVGGPAYLLPSVQRDKIYDIRPIMQRLEYGREEAFVIGAGAGPWPHLSRNCEMMMNIKIGPSLLKNETRIAWVDAEGKCVLGNSLGNETRFALLANLFASRGKTGKVLKVHAKRRIGQLDFIATMQQAIAARYSGADKLVGLGGTFLLKEGKAKQHVMDDFSKSPLCNVRELDNWLHFYDMSAPLVNVGTFVSAETELDLRVQHFHSFGEAEGGHYHIDTTPESVEYLGYFAVAETLYRIDQTPEKLSFGKD